MDIKVKFRPRRQEDRTVTVPENATIQDLMDGVNEDSNGTIAIRNGLPVPEDTTLTDGDEITILSAASGG